MINHLGPFWTLLLLHCGLFSQDTSAALERERLRVKNAEEERDAAVLRACASEGNLKVANSLRVRLGLSNCRLFFARLTSANPLVLVV